MLITNSARVAKYAQYCGVSRIFIDLEIYGKQARQGHLDTLISNHSIDDIAIVKKSITQAQLLVRVNPLHNNTQVEIDAAIESGADLLMLPMFQSAGELAEFSNMVAGRVGIVPLVETKNALADMYNITQVSGLSEIYIGLNDLHLDMGLKFIFEPLANGIIDQAVEIIKQANLPFGFGGVARVGEGVIPGELVLAEHVRLGSNSVILSRTFHRSDNDMINFEKNTALKFEMDKLFSTLAILANRNSEQVASDRLKMQQIVAQVLQAKV